MERLRDRRLSCDLELLISVQEELGLRGPGREPLPPTPTPPWWWT
jgi:putative aminopeptidase FrvX